MKRTIFFGILVLFIFCSSMLSFAQAQARPSANVVSPFHENERIALSSAFINGVGHWLRRYSPQLITQEDGYVLMTARYEYLLNIELFIYEEVYVIVVTIAEARFDLNRAIRTCNHILDGVERALINNLDRSRSRRR